MEDALPVDPVKPHPNSPHGGSDGVVSGNRGSAYPEPDPRDPEPTYGDPPIDIDPYDPLPDPLPDPPDPSPPDGDNGDPGGDSGGGGGSGGPDLDGWKGGDLPKHEED